MDFAAEPILDPVSATPPRTAGRPAAPDEAGPSFEDHLDAAVSEAGSDTESAAPVTDAKPPRGGGTQAAETPDAEAVLLGGPIPAPPVTAAVLVQIAAASETQAQPSAPPTERVLPTRSAQPLAPPAGRPPQNVWNADATSAPQPMPAQLTAKTAASETKAAPQTTASSEPSTAAQQQPPGASGRSADNVQPTNPAAQTAASTATAPEDGATQIAAPAQQALAATVAPTPQASAPAWRGTRDTAERGEAAPAQESSAPQPAVPNVKTQTANAAAAASPMADTAQAAQAASDAPDTGQTTQTLTASTTAAQTSTQVQHAAADTGAQRAPPAAQLGREIIRRFDGGATNFELRLDPPELGRVEVRMEVSRDHRVTAVIAADSPQALTELARHARELEAQLQSAGLQLSDNGLSFDLRQGAQGGDTQETNGASAQDANAGAAASEQQTTLAARPIGLERWRGVRVDMMV